MNAKFNFPNSGSNAVTDHQRFEFMQKLAADQRGENPLDLTDWENSFLASFNSSSRPTLWFTAGRRDATDKLWMKLGGEINHPFPTDDVRPRYAGASADGCEAFVRDDGGQRRCNEPAAWVNQKGFRYCNTCLERVQAELKKYSKGKTMTVQPFNHQDTKGTKL
jgi:hypothetical protein